MATIPLHSESVCSRGDLNLLSDASCDLDAIRVFANASERAIENIRDWVKMQPSPLQKTLIDELNDLDTLIGEARAKAVTAQKVVDDYCEVEAAHRGGVSNVMANSENRR